MFLAEQLESIEPKKIFTNKDKHDLPENLQALDIESIDSNVIDYQSALSALPLNLITNFSRSSSKSTVNWGFGDLHLF